MYIISVWCVNLKKKYKYKTEQQNTETNNCYIINHQLSILNFLVTYMSKKSVFAPSYLIAEDGVVEYHGTIFLPITYTNSLDILILDEKYLRERIHKLLRL